MVYQSKFPIPTMGPCLIRCVIKLVMFANYFQSFDDLIYPRIK
jgi:hypothetical protein